VYASTKFALEGLSEALRGELGAFNIHVSLRAGLRQTNLIGPAAAHPIADYDSRRQVGLAFVRAGIDHGMDPGVVAQTILHIATAARPRLRYRVGRTSNVLITLKRVLPESAFEWIRRRAFPAERARVFQPHTPSRIGVEEKALGGAQVCHPLPQNTKAVGSSSREGVAAISTKTYAQWGGIIFLVLGVVGLFVGDQFIGILNAEIAEDIAHLVLGVILTYVGFRLTNAQASTFAQVFGVVSILFGIVGFVDRTLFGLLPQVGLGAVDNIAHLGYGVVGFWAGRAYKPATA
jgi:hypothetical protein